MDKFLDIYAIHKPSQEAINHIYSPITRNEIGEIIKNLTTKKIPRLLNSIRPFKKNKH
jgi:hypothetical protein